MVTYYLVRSTKTGLLYSVVSSNYTEATKNLYDLGLDNWSHIFQTYSLAQFEEVTKSSSIVRTNIPVNGGL